MPSTPPSELAAGQRRRIGTESSLEPLPPGNAPGAEDSLLPCRLTQTQRAPSTPLHRSPAAPPTAQ